MITTTILVPVNDDEDISMSRYIPFDLSASKVKIVCVDAETQSTVQILYWNEGEISSFPDRNLLV